MATLCPVCVWALQFVVTVALIWMLRRLWRRKWSSAILGELAGYFAIWALSGVSANCAYYWREMIFEPFLRGDMFFRRWDGDCFEPLMYFSLLTLTALFSGIVERQERGAQKYEQGSE